MLSYTTWRRELKPGDGGREGGASSAGIEASARWRWERDLVRGFDFPAVGKTGVYRVWPWWLYMIVLGPRSAGGGHRGDRKDD